MSTNNGIGSSAESAEIRLIPYPDDIKILYEFAITHFLRYKLMVTTKFGQCNYLWWCFKRSLAGINRMKPKEYNQEGFS